MSRRSTRVNKSWIELTAQKEVNVDGNGVYLSVVNPFDLKTVRLVAEGKGNYLKAYDWSADDRKVVFCDFASNTASTLWVIDIATGEKALLSEKRSKEDDYYDNPQFSADGSGVYVITDRDSEFRRLVYVDLSTKQHKPLSDHIKWDVEDFKLSPDGRSLAFVTNEDGVSRLHLLETKTGKEREQCRLCPWASFPISNGTVTQVT